jgi:hypothetical protein
MLAAMNSARLIGTCAATLCFSLARGDVLPGDTADDAPFAVVDGLFDESKPDTLGLASAPGSETITVFRPRDGDNTFNHGAIVTQFKGQLLVQWQASRRDEDAPDTHVVYSTSIDGREWSEPALLAELAEDTMATSGGWWTNDEQLIAYINAWPDAGDIKQGGNTLFMSSADGMHWSEPAPVRDAEGRPVQGIFEQDPKALPGGRIISAFHMRPGLVVAPWYTDDASGTRGWTPGKMQNLPHDASTSRAIEPSWFLRRDGGMVMIFRDQADSFRKLAAVSNDRGLTWTKPVLTNMPDARTKQSAGNLPDGSAYLVGNPVTNRSRYPLVVTVSKDGRLFDRAWWLRAGGRDMQALKYPGRYKRPGYSYPKSAVIDDWLYVAYATNKEDIEITRVPVTSLVTGAQ